MTDLYKITGKVFLVAGFLLWLILPAVIVGLVDRPLTEAIAAAFCGSVIMAEVYVMFRYLRAKEGVRKNG